MDDSYNVFFKTLWLPVFWAVSCGGGVSCPVATDLCKFMWDFGIMCEIVYDMIVPDQVEVDVTSAGSGVVSEQ